MYHVLVYFGRISNKEMCKIWEREGLKSLQDHLQTKTEKYIPYAKLNY